MVRRRVLSVDAQAQDARAQRAHVHARTRDGARLARLDADPTSVRGWECAGLVCESR